MRRDYGSQLGPDTDSKNIFVVNGELLPMNDFESAFETAIQTPSLGLPATHRGPSRGSICFSGNDGLQHSSPCQTAELECHPDLLEAFGKFHYVRYMFDDRKTDQHVELFF